MKGDVVAIWLGASPGSGSLGPPRHKCMGGHKTSAGGVCCYGIGTPETVKGRTRSSVSILSNCEFTTSN